MSNIRPSYEGNIAEQIGSLARELDWLSPDNIKRKEEIEKELSLLYILNSKYGSV